MDVINQGLIKFHKSSTSFERELTVQPLKRERQCKADFYFPQGRALDSYYVLLFFNDKGHKLSFGEKSKHYKYHKLIGIKRDGRAIIKLNSKKENVCIDRHKIHDIKYNRIKLSQVALSGLGSLIKYFLRHKAREDKRMLFVRGSFKRDFFKNKKIVHDVTPFKSVCKKGFSLLTKINERNERNGWFQFPTMKHFTQSSFYKEPLDIGAHISMILPEMPEDFGLLNKYEEYRALNGYYIHTLMNWAQNPKQKEIWDFEKHRVLCYFSKSFWDTLPQNHKYKSGSFWYYNNNSSYIPNFSKIFEDSQCLDSIFFKRHITPFKHRELKEIFQNLIHTLHMGLIDGWMSERASQFYNNCIEQLKHKLYIMYGDDFEPVKNGCIEWGMYKYPIKYMEYNAGLFEVH